MILIKNAYLVSMGEINYEQCDILIENGIINKVEKNIKVEKCMKVIDALGRFATPGLIDPHCHVGVTEQGLGFEGRDHNEMTNPITPELRAIDAVNPSDSAFGRALNAGITTVVTGPGSANVIGGTFTILKTVGKTVEDMVVVEESAMKMALGENPKRVYSGKNSLPSTRMGIAALLRENLYKAREYHEKKKLYENDPENNKRIDFNFKLDSLSRVFDGMLIKIHAHRSDDIMTAIRIKNEFDLNMCIEHCSEGYLIPEKLKKYNVPCVIGPLMTSKSKVETDKKDYISGKVLIENNVDFAVMTDHPVVTLEHTFMQLGKFVNAGLSEFDALKTITINAAKLNNIDDILGSIEVGKNADIVIWSGNPFNYMTNTDVIIVNGEIEKEV